MADTTEKKYRLHNDVFVRDYHGYGYIMNQLNYLDRHYDQAGCVFLKTLSRSPQSIDEMARKAFSVFVDVDYETVRADFIEFIDNLEQGGYVLSGKDEEEIVSKEVGFSYKLVDNPKTIMDSFEDKSLRNMGISTTQDHMDELFRKTPTLQSVELEITNRCNERCVHCYIPHEDKTQDMDPEFYYDIVDQLAEMGTLGLTITGGEPLLHRHIVEFLRYARSKDLKLSLLSNATFVTDEIIQAIREARVNMIAISLYSMNPEEHDFITQLPGSHAKTVRNIERFLENDIPLQINCPLTKINYSSFPGVLEWCRARKLRPHVDHLLMARYDFSDSNLQYRMDDAQLEQYIRDAVAKDINYQERLAQPPMSSQSTKEQRAQSAICGAGVSSACINCSGDIFPCAGWQKYVIGNVRHQKIKDVWINSEKVRYLRDLRWSAFPKCLDCEASDYCALCLARNYNESKGDMLRLSDKYCEYAFLNRKIGDEYKDKKNSCSGGCPAS